MGVAVLEAYVQPHAGAVSAGPIASSVQNDATERHINTAPTSPLTQWRSPMLLPTDYPFISATAPVTPEKLRQETPADEAAGSVHNPD